MNESIKNRYEFVYLFDVDNGNPNGDPDAGNMPRIDPETNHGIVTDVCLKRKIRNYFQIKGGECYEIFVKSKIPLNPLIAEACHKKGVPDYAKKNGGWDTGEAKKRSQEEIGTLQDWLCKKYFDIRAFGAVLSTGPNAGQIQGPVQLTFSKSIEAIVPREIPITRVTDVDKEEGEMGSKHIVPYGLYRAEGYISANLARKTGFSEDDLKLLWESLINMFDHDHSAARGKMNARKLIVFKHDSAIGNAPAHVLFDLVKVEPNHEGKPARAFSDYKVTVDKNAPSGVEVIEKL